MFLLTLQCKSLFSDYVCRSHVASIRVTCRALQASAFASTANCIEAGCCPAQAYDPNKKFECFENVLGKIGKFLTNKMYLKRKTLSALTRDNNFKHHLNQWP